MAPCLHYSPVDLEKDEQAEKGKRGEKQQETLDNTAGIMMVRT